MERIYWITDGEDQEYVNEMLARYDGHVTMISAVSTDDQYCPVHAFVVVEFSDEFNPDTDAEEEPKPGYYPAVQAIRPING